MSQNQMTKFYAILKKFIPQESIDQAWQELKEAGVFVPTANEDDLSGVYVPLDIELYGDVRAYRQAPHEPAPKQRQMDPELEGESFMHPPGISRST